MYYVTLIAQCALLQYESPEVKTAPGLQLEFLMKTQGYILQDIAASEFGLHGFLENLVFLPIKQARTNLY